MAIKLITNYSKRLGLPGYSSHQFSVSVETELTASDDIAVEAERLYQLLQTNVDEQIQSTGFVPPADYGMDPPATNGASQGATGWRQGPAWKCSDKQRELILKLVEENNLNKSEVDALAHERFGKGVRVLSKMEASGLIDELIESYGSQFPNSTPRHNGAVYSGTNGRSTR